MQYCLVLNNTYEPLMVLPAKKAFKLFVKEKADILRPKEDDPYFHAFNSITERFKIPSVLILRRYVKFKRKPIQVSRKNILIRDKYICQYCGKQYNNMTVDHVHPQSKGGKNIWNNVVACCRKCNRLKADKTLEQCGLVLKKTPKEPSPFIFFRSKYLEIKPEWEDYLFI